MRTYTLTLCRYQYSTTTTNYSIRLEKQAASFRLIFYICGNRYNQCSGSGSTCFWASRIRIRILLLSSFYHQAKIVRKTLIPPVLWLLMDFLSLKNGVKVPSKSTGSKQKNCFKIISFLLASGRSMTKIAGSGSGSTPKCHGSGTLDITGRRFLIHR
jgi:hypothetical protein